MGERDAEIGAVVLAAGAGRRFGAAKQLAALDRHPLLEHALSAVARCPLVDRSVVVLGAHREEILESLDLHGVEPISCLDWDEGQSASLRTGLDALGDVDSVVVLLGDQPLVSTASIERVLAADDSGVAAIRASYSGIPSHPVVLKRALFPRIRRLRGDIGARGVLADLPVQTVPCDDVADPIDVDTPEDLEVVSKGEG